jgi:NodT family efflux transporter outer membrane factor (OMF) lipoprotein
MFHDAELTSLIQRAVKANYDLVRATARVEEARAGGGLARSTYSPQINADLSATRNRQIGVGALPKAGRVAVQRFPYEVSEYSSAIGLSWELDLFGRIRRGVEAATADIAASEQDRRNVLVILLGDVGRNYADLRGFQLRIEIAAKNIMIAEDTLELTKQRVKAGLATERDVSQAQAQLEAVRAQVPSLHTNLQFSAHRLAILLAQQPDSLESELSASAPVPSLPPNAPTGMPSDLLRRRPDILQVEAQLAAATARVGEAKADYFPRFNLLGNAGRQATQLHDLSLGLGNFFSVGPSVSLPVFTGGRIRSVVAIEDARVKEATALYQSTLLKAFEEVENALVAYGNEQERRDLLLSTVKADETAFDLANIQYKAGLTDFLTVLDAQRELYGNRDLLAQSQTQVVTTLVGLYQALGGGWAIAPALP